MKKDSKLIKSVPKIPSHQVKSVIFDVNHQIVFKMNKVVAPQAWSQLAIDIAASKYFYRKKENSIYDLLNRITLGFETALKQSGYTQIEIKKLIEDIKQGSLLQKFAFNSPVWFNCGLFEKYKLKSDHCESFAFDFKTQKINRIKNSFERPQNSACFIQSIEDSLSSIYDLLKKEALLFKFGSGSGTNFSKIRSRMAPLKSGGSSSGLISFLEIFDKSAGSIKSGGTTRRAAKMVCLDINHPEIFEFIEWKKKEELKAQALIRQGYDGTLDGEVYKTISGQNSNNSVRITDSFMKKMLKNQMFNLTELTHKNDTAKAKSKKNITIKKVKATDLWNKLCESAWFCADPGVQFHDTINQMNTCKYSGLINASNPCSEFMFLDDTACNLASLNLVKYLNENNEFKLESFFLDIDKIFKVQDALVDYSSYPSEIIAFNSNYFRPIGLGFANLGSLLIEKGIPYDSDQGRAWAGAITAALTGQSYLTSVKLAKKSKPFAGYNKNKKSVHAVFNQHKKNLKKIDWSWLPLEFKNQIQQMWLQASEMINQFGLRNSQLTLIAPTGTIGLVMDCGTTGIEPEFSIFKNKKMSGGGIINILNPSVQKCLARLGYLNTQTNEIIEDLLNHQSIFNVRHLKSEHVKIFQTAHGENCLSAEAHLKMMAAVQPFISGAISKTVNLPADATVQDISKVYIQAWKLKLKAVAVYRDQSKFVQPLNSDFKVNTRFDEKTSESNNDFKNPKCIICGYITLKEAHCFRCNNCGHTTSCVG